MCTGTRLEDGEGAWGSLGSSWGGPEGNVRLRSGSCGEGVPALPKGPVRVDHVPARPCTGTRTFLHTTASHPHPHSPWECVFGALESQLSTGWGGGGGGGGTQHPWYDPDVSWGLHGPECDHAAPDPTAKGHLV